MIIKTIRNHEMKKHKQWRVQARKALRYDKKPMKKPARYKYASDFTCFGSLLFASFSVKFDGVDLFR